MEWHSLGARFASDPLLHAAAVSAVFLAVALATSVLARKVVLRLTRVTRTDLDDLVIGELRGPVALTIALVGVWQASRILELPEPLPYVVQGVLMSVAVVAWTVSGNRVTHLILEALSRNEHRLSLVNARSLPVFEMAGRILVYGSAAYFFFLAWKIDLTAWLASAGIVGIAVGFAAKDTLANLFAGLFILADAPYKIGDYLILDSGERGRVTEIGLRTTRLLTRSDVEIILPNAVMANAKIINESGGPHEKERVSAEVGVAYGSDIDRVREILMEIARTTPEVVEEPAPRVRFRQMADSALVFHLLTWVELPEQRGKVVDILNTRIYKRLVEEGIEIPFPQRDVYLHHVEGQDG